jgi:hypothetical protein
MVIVADANGQVDSAYHTLVKHINSPIPIVMISWAENFTFNNNLISLKDYVLVCFCEYGWSYEIVESHIWGVNTKEEGYGDGRYCGSEWKKFDDWVRANPPKITFKRELLKQDVSDKVKPIEYPCVVPMYEGDSKDKFNARPINVFQYWGRSNECRIRIHGEIWKHAFEKGFQPCDNIYYIQNYLSQEQGEKWITLLIPHWARIDINQIMSINGLSKLSLSWPGAGFKCFRTVESPVNSVLVMHKNNYAWTYDWDETNCIVVEPGKEIEGIESALKNENLYSIYTAGIHNSDRYRLPNYISKLESIINNA